MSRPSYYFLSSLQQGLAAAINAPASGAARATVDVIVRPKARSMDTDTNEYVGPEEGIAQTLQLYGPGDILGFHDRVVARTAPQPDVGDAEPNYFPSIEFSSAPDFVWRFTPDVPDDGGLNPWITLIVLIAEDRGDVQTEFKDVPPEELSSDEQSLPRYIKIADQSVLPDPAHSRRWAHLQVSARPGLSRNEILTIVRTTPEKAVCRLMCPRRLRPGTRYAAMVVPTFELGRLAGRGEALSEEGGGIDAMQYAWSHDGQGLLELPYYYRWEFRTGLRGDFEHLVRLLEARELTGLGTRALDCGEPGYGVPGVESRHLGLEGALRSTDTDFTPWGHDSPASDPPPTQLDLAGLLNQSDPMLEPILLLEETNAIFEVRALASADLTEVHLSWQTDGPAASRLEYELEDGSLTIEESAEASEDDTKHEVAVTDLEPGRTYGIEILADFQNGAVAETAGSLRLSVATVVPPIYGRWYAARSANVDSQGREVIVVNPEKEGWLDVLNLDPRHRAAAGLGAEVVRKQQESLMAAAWDQLGDIDEVNLVLRRAQLGRESALRAHSRLGEMHTTADLLQITAPVARRVPVDVADTGGRVPAHRLLTRASRLPPAVLDGAFRRIARARGPLRRRQGAGRSSGVIPRLLSGELRPAGPPPEPLGMIRPCDVSHRLKANIKPRVALTVDRGLAGKDDKVTVTWRTENTAARIASGAWSGSLPPSGQWTVPVRDLLAAAGGRTPGGRVTTIRFRLAATGPGGRVSALATLGVRRGPEEGGRSRGRRRPTGDLPSDPRVGRRGRESTRFTNVAEERPTVATVPRSRGPVERGPRSPAPGNGSGGRPPGGQRGDPLLPTPVLCDGEITPAELHKALGSEPFADVADEYDPAPTAESVRIALDEWLERPASGPEAPPVRGPGFLARLRDALLEGLDPEKTFVTRTRRRLNLSPELEERFQEGVLGDPLDDLKSAPEFPQPMYEPLRDISHELILPGVEKIPQNTIGLLESNRRFIEAYMAGGLNHEFCNELLWREYPTDHRQTYFRQFWDVSEYVPQPGEADEIWEHWSSDVGFRELDGSGWSSRQKRKYLRRDLVTTAEGVRALWQEGTWPHDSESDPDNTKRDLEGLIQRLHAGDDSAVSELPESTLNALVKAVVVKEQLTEKLKDITRIRTWAPESSLGTHAPEDPTGNGNEENASNKPLVLVIRGQLLQRYPNAIIYAVDAMKDPDGQRAPGLPEYLRKKLGDVDGEELAGALRELDIEVIKEAISSLDVDVELTDDLEVEVETRGARWIVKDGSGDDAQRYEIHDVGGKLRIFKSVAPATPILPIFKATLPPDLTFFGFPFQEDDAKGDPEEEGEDEGDGEKALGKYFVIEERVGEPRFGLDSSAADRLETWDDLSWEDFADVDVGDYVDDATNDPQPGGANESPWSGEDENEMSSASRGWITFQKPVRVAIHANDMLPENES